MIKPEWHFMQTPKEKATELVKKFYNVDYHADNYKDYISRDTAKKCANLHISLILESEILKPSNKIVIEYYQEVLSEIEKL